MIISYNKSIFKINALAKWNSLAVALPTVVKPSRKKRKISKNDLEIPDIPLLELPRIPFPDNIQPTFCL